MFCFFSNFETASQNICLFTGGPAQPSSVMATIRNDTLTVTWMYSDPDNNLSLRPFLYAVRVESTGLVVRSGSVGPNEMSLTLNLTGFQVETQYDLELRANNLLGSSPVAGVRFTTAGGG